MMRFATTMKVLLRFLAPHFSMITSSCPSTPQMKANIPRFSQLRIIFTNVIRISHIF